MPHIRTNQRAEYWDHFNVSILERGVNGDDNRHRKVQVSYAPFPSQEAADTAENPPAPHCHLKAEGSVVDRFLWDADAGEWIASRSKLVPFVVWYLSGNPTEAELERCPGMEQIRATMEGVPMFENTPFEFNVTTLPEERDSE